MSSKYDNLGTPTLGRIPDKLLHEITEFLDDTYVAYRIMPDKILIEQDVWECRGEIQTMLAGLELPQGMLGVRLNYDDDENWIIVATVGFGSER